jgi:hypothetical protein
MARPFSRKITGGRGQGRPPVGAVEQLGMQFLLEFSDLHREQRL